MTVKCVWKLFSFAAMHFGQYRMQGRKACPLPGAHDLSRSYRQAHRQTLIDRMCFFRPYEHVRSVRHHMNKKVETSSPFFFSSTISLTLPPHVLKRGGGSRNFATAKFLCIDVKSGADAYLLTGNATAPTNEDHPLLS